MRLEEIIKKFNIDISLLVDFDGIDIVEIDYKPYDFINFCSIWAFRSRFNKKIELFGLLNSQNEKALIKECLVGTLLKNKKGLLIVFDVELTKVLGGVITRPQPAE